jgi:hypothetical protein
VTASVQAGAAQTDPAHAAASVINAIVPGLTTWTPAELAAAESEWAAAQPAAIVTTQSAFAAGVAWAIAHQTSTLTSGIAKAVAESTGKDPNAAQVVQTVLGDAVQVAEAAATGNDAAAVTEGVADVVQGVEALATAHEAEPVAASAEGQAVPGAPSVLPTNAEAKAAADVLEPTSEPKGDSPETAAQALSTPAPPAATGG